MYWLTELYIGLRDFMESGGPVLWYIAILVTFMWALIFERVYYFLFIHDDFASNIKDRYLSMKFKSPWHKNQTKTRFISEGKLSINKNIRISRFWCWHIISSYFVAQHFSNKCRIMKTIRKLQSIISIN